MVDITIKFENEIYGVYGKEFGRSIYDFQIFPYIDIEALANGYQDLSLNFPETTKYYSFSFMQGLFNPLMKIIGYRGFVEHVHFKGERGKMLKETAIIACLNDKKN